MGNKTSNLDYITDKQLQYVANKLSTEWKDVAVSLGLRVGQIDQTMEEYSNESLSMIKTRVLQIWRNKVGRNPRNISTLLKALEDNGRRDIVESIKVKLDKQVDFGRIFDELQHRESPSIFSADSSVQGSLLEPERRLDLRPGPVSDNQVRYPDSRFEPESRLELRPELASENQNKHPGSRLESERRLDLRPETVSENQSRYPGSRLESERRLDLRPETVSENQSRYPGSRLEHERRLVLHPEYQSGYPGNFLEPERFFEHHAETVNVPEVPYRHPGSRHEPERRVHFRLENLSRYPEESFDDRASVVSECYPRREPVDGQFSDEFSFGSSSSLSDNYVVIKNIDDPQISFCIGNIEIEGDGELSKIPESLVYATDRNHVDAYSFNSIYIRLHQNIRIQANCEPQIDQTDYGNQEIFGPIMSIPSAPSDYENPNQNDEGIQRECIILKKTNIHVVEGNIVTQKVDVILNSTHKNLDLSLGTCSSALRYAAGPEIQRECDQKYPNGIEAGELATTSGGRLNCNAIFHTALLKWPSRSSKKVHQEFIEKSLKEAQSRGYSSMAIPGLCTGYLQCPHKEAAERQCLYIKEFIEKHPSTTLKDIKLVASSNDKDMLKHLITAVKKIDRLSRNLYDEQSIIMNMEIKNTKLVVVKGRIEKSHVDVVVNIVNSRLQLNLGKVSRTLLKVGGDIIETECRRSSPHGIKLGEIVSTSGGNLPCKKVFHACMWDFNYKDSKTSKQIVSDLVENCLMMSHRANMMSIAFPFMRFWNIPPNHFAKAMYDGIQRFLSSLDASTIQNITIALSAPKFPLARTIRAFRDEFGVDNLTTEIPKDVVGFCYEMYKTEVTCPDYWDAFKEGMPLKQLALGRTQVYNLINIPVNDNMYEAIERLTKNTWDPSKIGFGRDAAGLTGYQDIQIIKIERIENINLWMRYGNERTYCFKKVVDQKCKFRNLTQLPGSRGVLLTTQHLPSVLQPRLYSEINEVYLFHGTKEENIYSILTDGLDKRLSSNAMFGSGIYFAESSTKADQYTDCKTDRSMDQKRFFLSRVCLGNTYIIEEPRSLRKPPCTICKEEVCRVHDRINFADSVVADGKCLFREFIVFNNNQCYPEYLITYARK